MTTADASIVEKIRKLLALAQSPNEHEAALAASKAQALLTTHALTRDDVTAVEFVHSDVVFEDTSEWYVWLLGALTAVNACRLLITADGRGARLVGPRAVLDGIVALYETLQVILAHLADEEWARYVEYHSDPLYGVYPSLLEEEADATWKTSFLYGAIARIEQRLQIAKHKAAAAVDVAAPMGGALIRLDHQLAKVDAFVAAAYVVGKVELETPPLDQSAALRGIRVGARVPLTAQRRVRGK